MSVYHRFPQFITTDPRKNRDNCLKSYRVDAEFMTTRHDCFFHNYNLTNKKVLDIGCCVAATGAYALSKGASFYHGVEYDSALVDAAVENLTSSFPKENWHVEQGTLEEFSKNNTSHYDVIVLSGVIYAVFDCIPILTDLSKNTDVFIIESIHPTFYKNLPSQVIEYLEQCNVWENFIENASFVEHACIPMVIDKFTLYQGSRPSLGFLKTFLKLLGFDYEINDNCINDRLKNTVPQLYNFHNRYGERFIKTKDRTKLGYVGI
jgi:16S rRNA G966 N2-methylase RsmD